MTYKMTAEEAIIVLNALYRYINKQNDDAHAFVSSALERAIEALRNERKKGKWNQPARYTLSCSVCGFEIEAENKSNYCPECGACLNSEGSDEVFDRRTSETVRATGEWLLTDNPDYDVCSNCYSCYYKKIWFPAKGRNFCPNCGADMQKTD